MAHRAVLQGHLLLIGKLGGRIELARVGHEGRRVHHGTGSAGIIHVREAVAIVVRDCVVHPGAHGDEPDKLVIPATGPRVSNGCYLVQEIRRRSSGARVRILCAG